MKIFNGAAGLLVAEVDGAALIERFCETALKTLDSVAIIEDLREVPRGRERAAFLDPRFCALSAGTIESAVRASANADAPLQSVCRPDVHPAWTFENMKIEKQENDIPADRLSLSLEVNAAEPDVVMWLAVSAYKADKTLAIGWKEFSIPRGGAMVATCPDAGPVSKPAWGAGEISVGLAVARAGRVCSLHVKWAEVKDADRYSVIVYGPTQEDCALTKTYSIRGIMHTDPLRGCLVNPQDGTKLVNRQVLPPLYCRCSAVVIGTVDEARRLYEGEYLAGALAFALPAEESLCVKNEMDVVRFELLLEKNRQYPLAGRQAQ